MKIWQKMKKNQFFVFRAPFFAEKRRIEKKRKTKFFRFGETHSREVSGNHQQGNLCVCLFVLEVTMQRI